MILCQAGHEPIVHVSNRCPLCDVLAHIRQYEATLAELRRRVDDHAVEQLDIFRTILMEIATAVGEPNDGGRRYDEIPKEINTLKAKMKRWEDMLFDLSLNCCDRAGEDGTDELRGTCARIGRPLCAPCTARQALETSDE